MAEESSLIAAMRGGRPGLPNPEKDSMIIGSGKAVALKGMDVEWDGQ
jgi:hypothetical protein